MTGKLMKALSGYAEWFWLMAKNWKDVENRNWPLPREIVASLPVRIYLHASKTPASKEEVAFIKSNLTFVQVDNFVAVDWSKLRGHIIGEVTVTGYSHVGNHIVLLAGTGQERSKWLFGEYGFWVKDGVLYGNPIPCKGKPGFFAPDVATEIKEA